ncbi:MAG: polyketide synthase dehydratase domain-containing protein [Anaerolineae bacterium]|nr:polyketide synthase dehydratase domain-containing protein [Anaerolineae bacterium]
MSDFYERISNMSPKRLMLLAMELQEKVEALEQAKAEPIAIVGMACRFPGGANSPEEFWQLLRDGVDAITDVPAARWDVDAYYDPDPNAPGKIASRWGGFVDNVDRFEPQIFGISPREAISMDPQQRLLLEVVWESLERAGYAPDNLSGSSTGVFVGICNSDYRYMITSGNPDDWDVYISTGNAQSVVSGRISYVLGLQGPSVSVDTACSSSLVATHLAVQALRNGECRMALAGGTNVILSPETTITLSRAGMMASDGRCKAFDAAADGFVRSEGCGVVVLKRLSDAVADGDNVLAIIRGSAINQDGRSNGLTAPNGPSQVAVIRAALENAGLQPEDISYIETHGTGTSLGDPIEVQALGGALGKGHSTDNPLLIGSLKANVGHMEAAAGIGGLIKTVLMLQHGEIPPLLHLHQPNPLIPWEELPISMTQTLTSWTHERRIAGVSSFGFSGTNGHIILETAPATEPTEAQVERSNHILALSARSENALHELAARFHDALLTNADVSVADVAFTVNNGRSLFPYRLSVLAENTQALAARLDAFVSGAEPDGVISGHFQDANPPEVAFLFTGHGSQYVDMGRTLYEMQPVFREAFDQCDALFHNYLDVPLGQIMFTADDADGSMLDNMAYAQPALFALQYALAQLWLSWGVKPALVMGHSLGEYAAAVIAGVFSLADGVKLVAARGRLMNSLPEAGEMWAVFTDEATALEAVKPYPTRVSVAVINGPGSVVISGAKTELAAVLESLKAQGIKSRKLAVAQASHSPMLDPMLNEFEQIASTIEYHQPEIGLVSCLTGKLVAGDEVGSAAYWRRHIRHAVRFADAITSVQENGARVFVEIGPNPTLIGMGQRVIGDDAGVWLPSLREKTSDWEQILQSLGRLYVNGGAVDWRAFDQPYSRHKLMLPTYPFQRERYWIKVSPRRQDAEGALHPLLGTRLESPSLKEIVFETHLNAENPAFLSHHRIFGVVILPSPAYIEMAQAAAQEAFGDQHLYSVENFAIYEALILPEEGANTVQIILSLPESDRAAFQVVSRGKDDDDWKLHVTGSIAFVQPELRQFDQHVGDIQARCEEEIAGSDYYARVFELGLEFGRSFQGISHLWRRDGEALGRIELPEALLREANDYGIHPAFLDACFHLVGAPLAQNDLEIAYLLIGIDSFRLYQQPPAKLWAYTRLSSGGATQETFGGDILLFDDNGVLIAEAAGLQLKRAGREALLQATRQQNDDWFYEVQWQPKAHPNQQFTPRTADFIPDLASIASAGVDNLLRRADENALHLYAELSAELDAVCAVYAVRALESLGVAFHAGNRILPDSLKIIDQHRRLLGRLLGILSQESIIRPAGNTWEVVQTLPELDADEHLKMLVEQYPAFSAEINILSQCGPHLGEILQGKRDPLGLLFPNGSMALTEPLYQDAPFARAYNPVVGDLVGAVIKKLPSDRPLRVLEIGAGTGATTASVLPQLPSDRTEYVFTDLSPLFMAKAEEKFATYSFLRTQLLDIERDPAGQGFMPHAFDVIIAANVLHATADLRRTLVNVKRLLAPGGLLLLLENTAPERWVDLTFGLTEGWWKFTDTDLRPTYPLLTPDNWLGLLSAEDFADAHSIPGVGEQGVLNGQTIIAARTPLAEVAVAQSEQPGKWLIFADNTFGQGAALANALSQRGESTLVVTIGDSYQRIGATSWQIDPASRPDFIHLLDEVGMLNNLPLRGVVYLWGLNLLTADDLAADDLFEASVRNCESVLFITQSLLLGDKSALPALWLVTGGTSDLDVAQSPLWGLGRVIALEHPEVWGGLIELEAPSSVQADSLLTEILHPDGEDQIAYRGAGRQVARLVRTTTTHHPVFLRSDAAYLITGGLGGLGLQVARWMAEHGAGHLVLLGRKGLPPREEWPQIDPESRAAQQTAAVEAIEELGAQVTVIAADSAIEAQMSNLFAQFGNTLPSLRGVIHAAADLSNATIGEMNGDDLRSQFRPKIAGTWILHQLTRTLELDFFILFSSTTALWGSKLLGHYAAANTFLDAFAHYRHGLGLPALSINWGTWEVMRVASTAEQQEVAQSGLSQMPTEVALNVMGDLFGSERAQMVVAAVDWDGLKAVYEARRARPLLEQVTNRKRVKIAQMVSAPKGESELLVQLKIAEPEARRVILTDFVQAEAARVLRVEQTDSVDIHQGLFDMGMDSLMSVELKSRLEAGVGQSLPSTLTFNYPTVADLAGYLEGNIAALKTAEPVPSIAEVAAAMSVAESLPDDIDDFSEDELADLLAKKLGRK